MAKQIRVKFDHEAHKKTARVVLDTPTRDADHNSIGLLIVEETHRFKRPVRA